MYETSDKQILLFLLQRLRIHFINMLIIKFILAKKWKYNNKFVKRFSLISNTIFRATLITQFQDVHSEKC